MNTTAAKLRAIRPVRIESNDNRVFAIGVAIVAAFFMAAHAWMVESDKRDAEAVAAAAKARQDAQIDYWRDRAVASEIVAREAVQARPPVLYVVEAQTEREAAEKLKMVGMGGGK